MWAVAESHPEMAQELIAHGADVNARQVTWNWERQMTKEPREKWMPLGGLTPLLFAARQGCLDCARILLKAGAEINAADPNNISSDADGAHQRTLRFRGVLARSGRRPEHRR